MATVGHYSVYAALLQTIVEGPEFADESERQQVFRTSLVVLESHVPDEPIQPP